MISSRLAYLVLACGVLLVATALLARNLHTAERLHPDEAHFLTFARNASVLGDGMLGGALDKPPVALYAQALSMLGIAVDADAQGVLHLDRHRGERAGRLVGLYSAVITVAILMALARNIGGRRLGIATGCFVATSPYTSAWGASAFLDMPMLAFSMGAWLAMSRGRAGVAGALWAVAFATKPQAIFFLPLIVTTPATTTKKLVRYWLMVALGVFGLLLWDAVRPETSLFALATANNIADDGLWGDVGIGWVQWWDYWGYLAGDAFLTLIVLGGAIVMGIRQGRWWWLAWLMAYATLHITTRLNIYDRYLLLTLPLIALLFAQVVRWRYGIVLIALLSSLMASITWNGHSLPIGGDKGDYRQIDELADYLNGLPIATVVYDTWLGWQLGYYMGEWSDKRRVHYPTPDALVEGALALHEEGRRYFVAPLDVPYETYLNALESADFVVVHDATIGRFVVYALTPPNPHR